MKKNRPSFDTKRRFLPAEHPRHAKKLAERTGAQKEWKAYLAALRVRHSTLRALHAELLKARL